MCKFSKLLQVFSLSLLLSGPWLASAQAAEETKEAKKPTRAVAYGPDGRPYMHVCPIGTEPVGEAPPKGGQMWCRQPIEGGYRRQGAVVKWYNNGKKRFEGQFERDKKHGTWTKFRPNGKKQEEITYYDGKKVSKTLFDRRGREINTKERDEREAERKAASKKRAADWKSYSQASSRSNKKGFYQ